MIDEATLENFLNRSVGESFTGSPEVLKWKQRLRRHNKKIVLRSSKRHPHLKSVPGVLLAEILRDADYDERIQAVCLYGLSRYRRGFERLAKLAFDLEEEVAPGSDDWETPLSKLLGELLITFGYMDTKQSHAFLQGALERRSEGWLRSQAIDGMAFEEKQFEPRLVLPFLTLECHPQLTLSALYALMLHGYFKHRRADLDRLVIPLLRHEVPMVRCYVVMVIDNLNYAEEFRHIYEGLLSDPDEQVRRVAREGIENLDCRLRD